MTGRTICQLLFCAVATIFFRCGGAADVPDKPAAAEVPTTLSTSAHLTTAQQLSREAYYDSSLVHFGIALTELYRRGSWDSVAVALADIGDVLSVAGQHRAALDTLLTSQAMLYRLATVSDVLTSRITVLIARNYVRMGQPEDALQLLEAANVHRDTSPRTQAAVLAVEGYAYYELDAYRQSIGSLQQALGMVEANDYASARLRARITTNLALAWFNYRNDYVQAHMYLQETLKLRKAFLTEDHPRLGEVYGNLGMLLMHAGLYHAGLILINQASEIFGRRPSSNRLNLAVCYSNLGALHMRAGEYDRADTYLRKSLDLRRGLYGENHPRLYYSLSRLAQVQLKRGFVQESRDLSRDAIHVWKNHNSHNQSRIAKSLSRIGETFLVEKLPDSAAVYFKRANDILETSESALPKDIAETLRMLGHVETMRGNHGAARRLFKRAIRRIRGKPLGHEIQIASITNDIAESFLPGDPQLALLYAMESLQQNYSHAYLIDGALTPSQPLSDPERFRSLAIRVEAQFLECLSSLCNINTYNRAITDLARSLVLVRKQLRTVESKLFLAETERDLLDKVVQHNIVLYRKFGDRGLVDSVFQLMEASKAGFIEDHIQQESALRISAITDSLRQEERRLRSRAILTRMQLTSDAVTEQDGDSLRESLLTTIRRHDGLLGRIELADPAFFALKYKPHVLGLADAAQYLGQDEALIEFFAGKDSLVIVAITRSAVSFAVANRSSVQDLVSGIELAIVGRNDRDYLSSASGLYDLLLKPVENVLDAKHLTIVPDGELYRLPFEALLTSASADRSDLEDTHPSPPYLIRNFSISYAYSATLRQLVSERRSPIPDREFLGVAPIFSSVSATSNEPEEMQFVTLPGSEREIRDLRRLFDPWYRFNTYSSSQILIGPAATEEALLAQEANRYRFIHFATHGFADEDQPERSGLALYPSSVSQDDFLHLGEVYSYSLSADLVVLGACDTGRGGHVKGEGVVGLAGGFLYAGAKNVVVSLWQVDDDASIKLMKPFYRHTLRMDPLAEALRKAKLSMIDSGTKYSLPYYWAPYVLFN